MLVIKVGEWESFNYYSNRASNNEYMWICRRLTLRSPTEQAWFVHGKVSLEVLVECSSE